MKDTVRFPAGCHGLLPGVALSLQPLCFCLNSLLDCWNLLKRWKSWDSLNTSSVLHHQLLWKPQYRITCLWKDCSRGLKGDRTSGLKFLKIDLRVLIFHDYLREGVGGGDLIELIHWLLCWSSLVSQDWLDIGFLHLACWWFLTWPRSQKLQTGKELSRSPAILISCLVNNPNIPLYTWRMEEDGKYDWLEEHLS